VAPFYCSPRSLTGRVVHGPILPSRPDGKGARFLKIHYVAWPPALPPPEFVPSRPPEEGESYVQRKLCG
jgi:hypothetical protein